MTLRQGLLWVLCWLSANVFASSYVEDARRMPASGDIVIDVLQPPILELLENQYSFGSHWGSAESSLQKLHANSAYRSLVEILVDDMTAIKKDIGVKLAFSTVQAEKMAPAGNIGRHFDEYWLSSDKAKFALIGVINRMDKKDFSKAGCGELRFIYRLAYHHQQSRSTLPVFINIVYQFDSNQCAELVEHWRVKEGFVNDEAYAKWLLSSPLALEKTLKQVEINMQAVRFPSGLKTHFGGQAVYLFRVLALSGNRLTPILLENTPDVSKISLDKTLRLELIKELSDNLNAIDLGVFKISDKFLADKVISYSTLGRSRMANKPFSTILRDDLSQFDSRQFSKLRYMHSPEALLERLDNRSCSGCHQAGGTAGFHLLGMPSALNSQFNQNALGFSSHYYAERARRFHYFNALLNGEEVNPFRPHSLFPVANWLTPGAGVPGFLPAKLKEFCLLDDKHFSTISCGNPQQECRVLASNNRSGVEFGECVYKKQAVLPAGHVCREGVIEEKANDFSLSFYNLQSHQDKIFGIDGGLPSKVYAQSCATTKGGVPLGRVSVKCQDDTPDGRLEFVDGLKKDLSNVPESHCAMIGGVHFDLCAASENPVQCMSETPIRRSQLDSCYMGQFCREDFICQQLPLQVADAYAEPTRSKVLSRLKLLQSEGVGFCTPNYFLFNMRVDGHPLPEGRLANNDVLEAAIETDLPEGFVDVKDIDPSIVVDMRYASKNNFTHDVVPGYQANRCILQEEVAQALSNAQRLLQNNNPNLSLKVLDCYRPQMAVDHFVVWSSKPETPSEKQYFPNVPKSDLFKQGYIALQSSHSKGVSVDVTIVDLSRREPLAADNDEDCTSVNRKSDNSLDMGSGYDCFDSISHTNSTLIANKAQANRQLLLSIMSQSGLTNYHKEWWHFHYRKDKLNKAYNFLIKE